MIQILQYQYQQQSINGNNNQYNYRIINTIYIIINTIMKNNTGFVPQSIEKPNYNTTYIYSNFIGNKLRNSELDRKKKLKMKHVIDKQANLVFFQNGHPFDKQIDDSLYKRSQTNELINININLKQQQIGKAFKSRQKQNVDNQNRRYDSYNSNRNSNFYSSCGSLDMTRKKSYQKGRLSQTKNDFKSQRGFQNKSNQLNTSHSNFLFDGKQIKCKRQPKRQFLVNFERKINSMNLMSEQLKKQLILQRQNSSSLRSNQISANQQMQQAKIPHFNSKNLHAKMNQYLNLVVCKSSQDHKQKLKRIQQQKLINLVLQNQQKAKQKLVYRNNFLRVLKSQAKSKSRQNSALAKNTFEQSSIQDNQITNNMILKAVQKMKKNQIRPPIIRRSMQKNPQ